MIKSKAFIFLLIILALLAGCTSTQPDGLALNSTSYARALEQPDQLVLTLQINPATGLQRFRAVEAFDWQIAALLEYKQDLVFQPQYLASLVLVTDLAQTNRLIGSFAELAAVDLPVSLSGQQASFRALVTGVSYILDQDYTLQGVTELLGQLHAKGLLAEPGQATPYRIMFDYEAVELIKSGQNLLWRIPREGTLTMQKGLLALKNTELPPVKEEKFLAAGLRLLDGQADAVIYPPANAYQKEQTISDYTSFNQASLEVWRTYRRQIQQIRRYSTADMREHLVSALLFISLAIAWAGYMARRVLNQSIRSLIYLIVLALVSWTIFRMVKYEMPAKFFLTRYVWYAYYIFQLGLPLLLARVASLIDRTEPGPPPGWWRWAVFYKLGLLLLIFTNDLHKLVFQLDLTAGWDGSYSYGPGYYVVLLSNVAFLLSAVGLLLHKARQNPRKKALLLPLALTLMLLAYALLYVLRLPLAWESDFTITVGIFTLLFLQSAMSSGLIPVNSRHASLFKHSPLAMEIKNEAGDTVLAARKTPQSSQAKTRFARIRGGLAVWREDHTAEKKLQESLNKTIQELAWSNEILSHEHRIKSELAQIEANQKMQAELQGKIGSQLTLVNELFQQTKAGELPVQLGLARINLLLTYIKRRYNLIFWSRRSSTIGSSELLAYLAELGDVAAGAGLVLALLPDLEQDLSLPAAIACYSFLFEGLWQLIKRKEAELIARLSSQADLVNLQLLADRPFSNDFTAADLPGCQIKLRSDGYLHQASLEVAGRPDETISRPTGKSRTAP